MLRRLSPVLLVFLLAVTAAAPQALAQPAPADPVVQPVGNATPPAALAAPIASAQPGSLTTPDGWVLTVGARSESIEPVASLTESPWSREYRVHGSFEGTVTGSGTTRLTGGTLEAGYQIGCGITQDAIESISTATGLGGISIPFVTGSILPFVLGAQAGNQIKIDLKPGEVNIVPVGKKSFEGTLTQVNITGFRLSVDGCAGQSFIRSYATFKSSTANTDDIVTYLGVTRAV
ncbi:MAG: MspA family porin [Actinomycetia bacterium]|nr:MspA family porin [Actinomycetes bacterium]MCH9699889.1 MspA family porin [Actinomycetes bacterium]MCH9760904.1 MspA family porin [Actinomycetes bacterium]